MTEEPIQTERLLLRLWRRSDAAAFHTIWGDPEVIGSGYAKTPQESAEELGRVIDRCSALPAGYGWYAVMRADQQIIGNVCLQHPRTMPDETEIGWHFTPKSQGQGFATEAARALLALGFETLDVDRIIAVILPTNPASQRVAQRLGMQVNEHIEHADKPLEVWSMTRAQFAASTTD